MVRRGSWIAGSHGGSSGSAGTAEQPVAADGPLRGLSLNRRVRRLQSLVCESNQTMKQKRGRKQ